MKTNEITSSSIRPERFRERLQSELARRCGTNPHYSLRALALDLDVDHSTLSQLLRAKRPMTAATIERLGAKLGLPAEEIARFLAAERAAPSEDGASDELRRLTADALAVVSDWHHFAILELLRLPAFQPDSRWIARVLEIDVDEVNVALSRLIHLGMLEMAAPDRWVDRCGDAAATLSDFPRVTVERLAGQVRELALRALADAARRPQHHSSTVVAVARARLPEALVRLERLRAELLRSLDVSAPPDDVYQLELRLFPLTRGEPRDERPPRAGAP